MKWWLGRRETRKCAGAQPFCDGTHSITQTEESGKLYWYDDAGQRHVAVEGYSSMRSDKQPQKA